MLICLEKDLIEIKELEVINISSWKKLEKQDFV